MNNDDLKRLITQYEQWQSTGNKYFDEEDVLYALQELLNVREAISEFKDAIDNSQL